MIQPRIAIVTANFGGIDTPKRHARQSLQAEWFHFSETNSPCPFNSLDPRMHAKWFKLQSHKISPFGFQISDFDYVIWADANVQIKSTTFVSDLLSAIRNPQSAGIALRPHPFRDCIYAEAKFVTDGIKKGNKYLTARYAGLPIQEEVDSYAADGYPPHAGLWWCGLFIRPLNEKMNAFFDAWWDSCLRWSCFDQNSFPYLARKFDIKIKNMDWGHYYDNDTYSISKHLKIQ